jgi:hypothetical protein
VTDRIVARARRRLDPHEPVQASAGGYIEVEGRRRPVAMVVTDRRLLVIGRRGDIRHEWQLADLCRENLDDDADAGRLRIGAAPDEVVVAVEPPTCANAVLALARERLS